MRGGCERLEVEHSDRRAVGLHLIDIDDAEDRRVRVATLTTAGSELVAQSKADVWVEVEAAARALCADLNETILEQLETIEKRLGEKPLQRWSK